MLLLVCVFRALFSVFRVLLLVCVFRVSFCLFRVLLCVFRMFRALLRANFNVVCVCVSLDCDSSDSIEDIIIKLGTVIASDMLRHQVFIKSNVTFIQGYTDLNHENNKCLIISEAIQAMPITFAVKIV